MNQRRYILISAIAIASVSTANAQSGQYYPEASLTQIYTQEQIEQKRADEMEHKAVEQRDYVEKQKREVEKQVAAHRYNIEGMKMKQEKAQSELDSIAVDLSHVNGDLASYQSEHQQLEESSKATLNYLEGQRNELANKQQAVDQELHALSEARKKAEKEVYAMGMDVEHYKMEIARAETKIQEAGAARASLEADEMKVRGEWMQTKMAAAEHARMREEALADLAEAKKRFEQAHKELSVAKADLAKAEKARNDTSKKVNTQVAQFESDIMKANKNRILNEAERIRLESEVTKIQDYAARIKDSRDQAVDQSAASEGLVMKSSLALESARAALTTSVEGQDQSAYRADKMRHRARGLAAADEAAHMLPEGRVWVTSKSCKAYGKPDGSSPAGFFDSGKKLLGKDHGSRWVEISNGSGTKVFVDSHCGSYEN